MNWPNQNPKRVLNINGKGGQKITDAKTSKQLFLKQVATQLYSLLVVGCFGSNGPFRHYFSLYRAVSQREGEREEKGKKRVKNVQTTPTRTYCKRNRPLPYYHPICRTPRHWKFTQDHRTTRPPHTFTELNNRIHRSVKIQTFKILTAPNIKQIKPQRKYRFGTVSNN